MAVKIKFTSRTGVGKGTCRKLRTKGMIPAVFYGPEYKKSVVGTVLLKELSHAANSPNWETNMIDLEMPDGRVEMALLRSVQRHAVSQNILHVDLYQLMKDHKVKVAVPVRVINKEISSGVKMGGILEQPVRDIEMLVFPREIPSEIVLDTAKLQLGAEIFVRDIERPPSAELVTPEDSVVVIVSRPRSMTETPAEELAEETTDVEVVGKNRRKEEDE
ncbi:MAG: 50S ribosomal protein L25 [Synergistaceae bacterium]|jgi:large subunit ribosomal protein L25|nr:50S ribosomal protein L25 [Synergistaceae bacterium]